MASFREASMRKLFFLLVFFHFSFGFCALPLDDQLIHGKLDNGFTYYIKENSYPKQKALLRLLVKVGSIHEEEDEKGVAHFLEHLMFRGSRHFKDGEVIKYLESIGCWAGADTNAYTSFDSTIYQLDIPLDKPHSLKTALTILSDIAAEASLDEKSIQLERNVVLDELQRDLSSPHSKLSNTIFQSFLPDSLYADHFPIGLQKVVQTISPERIRDFYKRWYRPDRMALVAIGDFDGEKIREAIQDIFGKIACPSEPIKELRSGFDEEKRKRAVIHYDPELTSTEIALFSFCPTIQHGDLTEKQIRQDFLSHAITLMFQNRLSKLAHEGDHFLATDVGGGSFIGDIDYFYIEAELFEDRYQEALKSLNEEIRRVVELGFTPSECEKVKKQWKSLFKRRSSNADKIEHESYLSNYVDHFINNRPLLSNEWLSVLAINFIEELDLEEINHHLSDSYLANPFMILLATPSKEIYSSFSAGELATFLDEEIAIFEEREETLLSSFEYLPQFPTGELLSVQIDDLTTQLTLSNGIHLTLKSSDLEKNRCHIFAQAKGGLASFTKEELPSAKLALDYALLSGLGGLTYSELTDFLESQGINVYISFNSGIRTLHLSASQDQVHTLFELLHAFFAEPQFERAEWDRLIAKKRESSKQFRSDPDHLFQRFVKAKNSDHYFYFQTSSLKDSDEELARKIFDQAFGNVSDFTFFVVGDFDFDEIRELSSDYLASLPVKDESLFPSLEIPELFPQEMLYEDFCKGHKTYTTNVITFPYNHNSYKEHCGNSYNLLATTKLLEQHLHEILRQQLGNTYGVSVATLNPFYPDYAHSQIQIEFTCQIEHRKMMIDLVLREIENMQHTLPQEEEVATIQTLFLKSIKEDALHNAFWINALHAAHFTNSPLHSVIDYESAIGILSPEGIRDTAQLLFSSPYYTVLGHLPEDNP